MENLKEVEMLMQPQRENVLHLAGCDFREPMVFTWDEFDYTFDNMPFDLAKINYKKSLHLSQNRISRRINKDVVSRYEIALKQGDKFPALVVYKDKDNDIILSDGFHTYNALVDSGITSIRGIYKFGHPNPFEVSMKFNVRTTGYSEPVADTIVRAIDTFKAKVAECEKNGSEPPSQKEWCKDFLISQEKFNEALRIAETRVFLAENDVNVSNIPHEGCFEAICRVKKTDESGAVKIAKVAADYKLPRARVCEIVDDWLDPSIPTLEKDKIIEKHRLLCKKETDNGRKVSKVRRKNNVETTFKVSLTTLANQTKKVDEAKLKNFMSDPVMKQSAQQVLSILQKLLR